MSSLDLDEMTGKQRRGVFFPVNRVSVHECDLRHLATVGVPVAGVDPEAAAAAAARAFFVPLSGVLSMALSESSTAPMPLPPPNRNAPHLNSPRRLLSDEPSRSTCACNAWHCTYIHTSRN